MLYTGELLRKLPETTLVEEKEEVIYDLKEEVPFTVRVENDVYIVEGELVRKILGSVNLNNFDSLQYFQRAIQKAGIIGALKNQGIKEGNIVRMYDLEFDYIE